MFATLHASMSSSLGRPLVLLSSALFFLVSFLTLFRPHSGRGLFSVFSLQKQVGIHFVLPATSTNNDACRLMFSGAALGYPEPVLLGWEGRGRWNGSESHLFKISETLDYLTTLRKNQDDELVLILDAYDIWLQLPPEVLIRRYHRALDKSNQRLEKAGLLDKRSAEGVPIRNTILFGADKFCWPQNGDAIPCWAAPESTFSDTVFGPDTDREEVTLRPRFLNSGTIMGPVKDIRDLFRATMNTIELEFDEDFDYRTSDQHYLSMVWGEQERARIGIQNRTWTVEEGDERTDFHVAIDIESDAFQVNHWRQYVTWMSFNHSSTDGLHIQQRSAHNPGRLDRLSLPQDLMTIPGPFSAGNNVTDDLPTHLSWKDVMLGTNTVTGEVFPVYHGTGFNMILGMWWPRMWFHPHGYELMIAARRRWLSNMNVQRQHPIAQVDDVEYVAVEPSKADVFHQMRARDRSNQKGGAWSDLGEYLRWDEICGDYEAAVFVKRS